MFESDEREFLRAEGGLEFLAVGENVFAGIPVGEAEIQNLPAIELGDAAGSSAETVDKPGEFGKRFKLKDLQAANRLEMPGSRDFYASRRRRQGLAGFATWQRGFSGSGHPISIIGNERQQKFGGRREQQQA